MKRKLAEIWELEDGNYYLRVEVGAFQRQFTSDKRKAEDIASYEVIEILRKIVRESDTNKIQILTEKE